MQRLAEVVGIRARALDAELGQRGLQDLAKNLGLFSIERHTSTGCNARTWRALPRRINAERDQAARAESARTPGSGATHVVVLRGEPGDRGCEATRPYVPSRP